MKKLIKKFYQDGAVLLKIKVLPGAAKTCFQKTLDDGLIKVSLKSIPEKGRANDELVRYLTNQFGVGRGNVKIIRGQKSRVKIIKITS